MKSDICRLSIKVTQEDIGIWTCKIEIAEQFLDDQKSIHISSPSQLKDSALATEIRSASQSKYRIDSIYTSS